MPCHIQEQEQEQDLKITSSLTVSTCLWITHGRGELNSDVVGRVKIKEGN